MNIKISFLGAAGNVTGSRYLIEANNKRILVDCGMHQERQFRERDWLDFPFKPETLDAVLLTHAHLDHSGLLPRLVKKGCRCPIYCTPATKELVAISLIDSAELQQEDSEFKKLRHAREKKKGPRPEIPLYTPNDVTKCLPLFSAVVYGRPLLIGDDIEATFYDAGHILGSSIISIKILQDGQVRKLLFSGDLGRMGSPILRDPVTFDEADYVILESTYGDRVHESRQKAVDLLENVINKTAKAGGNIVIPTFVIERAQDILYYYNELLRQNDVPHLAVFVDSPMAAKVTEVFKKYPDIYDEEMTVLMQSDQSFFDFSKLHFVVSINESKAINHIKGTIIIMAGSGMCTGGRIKHHLVSNISRKESTVLFVGYQAQGTLGRLIADGAKKVRILGKEYPVRARIANIDGFSAHADKDDLLKWLSALKKPPRHLFVTHGEPEGSKSFAAEVVNSFGWQVSVPAYLDELVLG